jgi:outer membrane receptor protein involved in Fe transport
MVHCVRYSVGKRRAWFAGIAAAALMAASAAQAQTTYTLDIASGGLEPALLSLAAQTKQQIFFHKTVVAGRRAPAVRGELTPEQALAQMLAGSGLRARRVNPELVVVERASAQNAAPASEARGERPFGGERDATPAIRTAQADASPVTTRVEPVLVEEVKVTGTNLRGAAPASPLVVMSREELERTGQTTVADALRTLPANYGGGASDGGLAGGGDRVGRNTGYGTGLNLRGLGNGATLVLVNGRRLAGSGLFGDFADVSGIPTAAVQRVEVLLDGASAVYGSDAVGGVVNIILRTDYDGGETRVLGGIGTAGEPAQGQFSQVFGDRWNGGGFVLAYELQRRDALRSADRAFAADADLRPLGGSDQRNFNGYPANVLLPDPVTRALAPAYAVPAGQNGVGLRPSDFLPGVVNRSNQRSGLDVLPRQTLNAAYLAFDQALGEHITLSGDVRFSARRFKAHGAPFTSTFTVTRANPFYVSPIGAPSQVMNYAFLADLPNPVLSGTAETLGVTLGGTARLPRDWQAEAYASFAQSIDESRTGGVVHALYLAEALGGPDRPETAYQAAVDGYFNPFTGIPGSNATAPLAHIASGFTLNRTRDRVSTVSLQADGPLWRLPAGDLKLALGAQARRETLIQTGSNFSSTPAPVAQAGADVGRTVTAGFAELRAPLFGEGNARPGLARLELSLAVRLEHYEGIGTTTNPKAGLVWVPVDDVRLRATYGRSFRAPALREAFDAPRYTPTLFPVGAARVQALLLAGGNRDLEPETADTWTVGVDWSPARWPGLSLSLSAYDIRFKDRIDRPVQTNIVNALVDPTLSSFVTRISPATNPADRALIQSFLDSGFVSGGTGPVPAEAYAAIVDNRYVNTATLKLRGVDLSGRYRFDLGDDEVSLAAQATYVIDFKQQVTPTSPIVDRVGVINFPVRFRGRATGDWTRGPFTLGAAVNYTSRYRDLAGTRIGDLTTFDLQGRWDGARGAWRGVSVLLNLRNVFDKDPPFYDNPLGIAYDGALGDPIGRFVSLQITRAW